jgi:hypothetical protein
MTRHIRAIVWPLAISGLLTGGALAQERAAPVTARVAAAQGLLIAAYPELREAPMSWRVETTSTAVRAASSNGVVTRRASSIAQAQVVAWEDETAKALGLSAFR